MTDEIDNPNQVPSEGGESAGVEHLLTFDDLCAIYRCSRSTMYKLLRSGHAPPASIDEPRFKRWRADQVREAIKKTNRKA